MWKPNHKKFLQFIDFFRKLPPLRLLLAISYLLLASLYPGQNPLQRTVLHPGVVRGMTLPQLPLTLYPQSDGTSLPPTSAKSIVIQDLTSKTILYSRNPDTRVLPASTTKIMTALVALDTWPDLSTVITVQNEDRAIGQTISLIKGEQLTIQSLLYGLLVHSGNDASLALADNHPDGYAGFVNAMNKKAKELHLDNTFYKNPSGVEQYGHVTTARDLAVLASVAINNPQIADIVATRQITIFDVTQTHSHYLESTNELLGILPGLRGLKTGWTENAGECLVSYVERDGNALIFVVMGSADRFGDTTALVDWAYSHHQWLVPTL